MIDAAGDVIRRRGAQAEAGGLSAVLLSGAQAVEAAQRFEPDCAPMPAQHPLWIANWIRHSGTKTVLALVYAGERAVFGLPLELVEAGTITIARYLSGTHANGNFPLIAAGSVADPGECARLLVERLRTGPERIDLLSLNRQWDRAFGHENPFLAFDRAPSPDSSFSLSLEGGFDRVLECRNGKRKRKRHRWQVRKYESFGGYRHFRATTPEEVARCLDGYFTMKAGQFAARGIPDPFASPSVRTFFRGLFADALACHHPPFELHGLEVGGELRAVSGYSIVGSRIVCEFTAFADDELASMSPGDFLFYESIRLACERGLAEFDFSIGDQPYKRLWCDTARRQFDSLVPLTPRGRAAAVAMRAIGDLRRRLKANAHIRHAVQEIRRAFAGRKTHH